MVDCKAAFEKFLQERYPSAKHADDYESWRKEMKSAFIAGIDYACDTIEDITLNEGT